MLKSSFIALSAAGMLTGATLGMTGSAMAQDDYATTWTKYQEAVRVDTAGWNRDVGQDHRAVEA